MFIIILKKKKQIKFMTMMKKCLVQKMKRIGKTLTPTSRKNKNRNIINQIHLFLYNKIIIISNKIIIFKIKFKKRWFWRLLPKNRKHRESQIIKCNFRGLKNKVCHQLKINNRIINMVHNKLLLK
jgi:hypothetical protein